jgi:hypothetical protein
VAGFFRGFFLAIIALVSPALIFVGLTLFTVGVGLWPIALSLTGALGLGVFMPAMASMREESRWSRMNATPSQRCAHCKQPIGPTAFIRAPSPLKGVIHAGCYSKAFVRQQTA